jgi:hypothetical protein
MSDVGGKLISHTPVFLFFLQQIGEAGRSDSNDRATCQVMLLPTATGSTNLLTMRLVEVDGGCCGDWRRQMRAVCMRESLRGQNTVCLYVAIHGFGYGLGWACFI